MSPPMTVDLNWHSRPNQRGHPSITVRITLAYKACLSGAAVSGNWRIDLRVSPHLYPNGVCTHSGIGAARVPFRMPREIYLSRHVCHQLKLMNTIAIEVDGPNAEMPECVETGWIKMGVVEIT